MKISVIIPTLNEEHTVEKTLRQIRSHLTDFDHEIIVTDSGSTDRTVAIAKRYGQVVVDASPAHTIASNKNNGARLAHGEYLVFIDADVFVPDPNAFFKIALSNFGKDKKLVAITANLMVFPETATRMDNIVFTLVNLDHWFNNNVTHTGSASGEFQMIKRTAFEAVHGYQKHLAVAEDNDMFRRLAKIGHTRIERRLTVYHTGRRAHEIGWAHVLWDWGINYFSVRLFNRSYNKEWKVIR
ncbi:MAG: glycosyltransferase [Minisyncoccia bacterium]|jgi:glycosyltransferase involved in cell wall biosynthesis